MKILIVEDEKDIAHNIAEYLRDEAFTVDIAYDGETAVESICNPNLGYECILLDILLPKKNGLTVCREVRSLGVKTPIIMLTALDSLDNLTTGLDIGADDYIAKPFSFRELISRIKAVTRRTSLAEIEWSRLRVADLELDTKTKTAFRWGREIPLSRIHFQILEVLMRHAGSVLSKSDIENRVWESKKELWSDVVRTHIQMLRVQIDRDFDTKLIQTVRGLGYKIQAPENM